MEYTGTGQSRANLPEAKKGNGFTIFIAVVTAIVLFAGGMFGYAFYQDMQTKAHFQQVTIAEAADIAKKDDNVMVIMASKTCSHCQEYKPIAQSYAKDNKTKFYYVDLAEGNNQEDMKNHTELSVSGTPTTFYFHKGTKVNSSEGKRTTQEIQKDIDTAKAKGFEVPKA